MFLYLSQQVHPLVLGNIYRARSQIRMLARRLIGRQVTDEQKIQRILDFLCSESGSHDYTIFRQEARDELGLRIERPDDDLYSRIKALHADFSEELQLHVPFSPEVALGAEQEAEYSVRRSLIESVAGGSHFFESRGRWKRLAPPAHGIQDIRAFEGWRHEDA